MNELRGRTRVSANEAPGTIKLVVALEAHLEGKGPDDALVLAQMVKDRLLFSHRDTFPLLRLRVLAAFIETQGDT